MLTNQQIDEAFKEYEEGKIKYPPVNLKPKDPIPQVFGFNFPGTDQFVLFLGNYTGKYDEASKLKPGATMAQVLPMSLSTKGSPTQLKGGLGSDPIGAISSIFDTAYSVALKHNIGALMFRFPIKKMKGQGAVLMRVMSRLVHTKTAGRFEVLETPATFQQSSTAGKKYAFLIIAQKTRMKTVLSKLEVDLEKFEKFSVGGAPQFRHKKTGEVVDEQGAKLISTIEKEQKKPEKVPVVRFTRSELARMYSLGDVRPALEEQLIDPKETQTVSASTKTTDVVDKLNDTGLRDLVNSELLELHVDEWDDNSPKLFAAADGGEFKKLVSLVTNLDIGGKLFSGQKLLEAVAELSGFGDPDDALYDRRVRMTFRMIFRNMITQANELFNVSEDKKYEIKGFRVLSRYSGNSNFRDINNTLLGTQPLSRFTIKEIQDLDQLFVTQGIRLPKGVSVYRGQPMPRTAAVASMERKTFYFANYVSTSLLPIMFSFNHFARIDGMSLTGGEVEDPNSIDFVNQLNLAFVINNAHETKAICTLPYDTNSSEMEVVLPRGTIIHFDRINEAGNGKNFLIQASVVTNLYEHTEVYDGDLLFETGEVHKLKGFKELVTEAKKPKDSLLNCLADLMDFNSMPERFKS